MGFGGARPLAFLSVLVGFVLLAPVYGCQKADQLRIEKVLVDVEPAAEGMVDRERVRRQVASALGAAEGLEIGEEGSGGAIARLQVRALRDHEQPALGAGAGQKPGAAAVHVDLEVNGETRRGKFAYRGAGRGLARGALDGSVDALMKEAIREAIGEVVATRAMERRPEAELVAVLSDPSDVDTDTRVRAIRILGARKVKAAVSALQEVLAAERGRTETEAALAALTAIGDPRAVDAVIAFANGKPPQVRKLAIEAVRVMGTKTGEAWLFTLSTGHPDPEVQVAAELALADVAGRTASARR